MSSEVVTGSAIMTARQALRVFETAHRADDTEYLRLAGNVPHWLDGLVYRAHLDGDILPDDWRYRFT